MDHEWVDVCPIENGRCSIAMLVYGRVFILRTCTFLKLILLIRNLCHQERNHKSWVSAFMQQHNKGTTRIVIPIIFLSCTFQVMVNWWFGFVVWLSRIPLWKELLLRGTPDSNPQPTGPPNHRAPKPISWRLFFRTWLLFFTKIYGRKNPGPQLQGSQALPLKLNESYGSRSYDTTWTHHVDILGGVLSNIVVSQIIIDYTPGE